MLSPSPVPLPVPLVEKKGSAARASVAASIPCPVSSTRSRRKVPGCRPWGWPGPASSRAAETVSAPPPGIASRALAARFRIAISSWLASATAGGRSLPAWTLTRTCGPTVDTTRCLSPSRKWARSTGPTARGWRRAKARRRLTRTRALGRLHGPLDQPVLLRAAQRPALEHVQDAHDGGEEVVEVVGHAPRELADHLHLLRLPELRLGLREARLGANPVGHVGGDLEGGGHAPLAVAQGVELQLIGAPVGARVAERGHLREGVPPSARDQAARRASR